MRIFCDSMEVFEGREHRELERMLMRVRLGQHELLVDDLETFFASAFFQRAVGSSAQAEVRELLERQQQPALGDRALDPAKRVPGPRAELVPITTDDRTCRRDGDGPVWELDPATVGEWSEAPLRVLLENDDDWHLVEAAARVYERPKVVEAKRNDFLRTDQRGGKGEVKNAVESCGPSERIFVFMDSDRMSPEGDEDKPQRKIRELARERPHILPFILAKREVENYFPQELWERMVAENRSDERVRSLRTWKRLPDADKDYVDLEKVFGRIAKMQSAMLADPQLLPDAAALESRAGKHELRNLLDHLEAWL